MIRLDRSGVKAPDTWEESVRKAFPDGDLFRNVAAVFEALGIDDPARRKGFRSYGAHVFFPAKSKKGDFKPIWGDAKEALALMAHYKCAYCESPIAAESTGEVEHFKPKTLFPSLVYEWSNYFLACGGCNRAKLNKWPAGGKEYVRPDEGDPPAFFLFGEDGSVAAVLLGEAGDLTIRDLKLNKPWLRRQRALEIQEALDELRLVLQDPGITPDARKRLVHGVMAKYQNPAKRYSAAVTQCLRRLWEQEWPGVPF
jgi:uncharacterized protein (TIGR02646 family)